MSKRTNLRADRRYIRWSFLLCLGLLVFFFWHANVQAATNDKIIFLHRSTGGAVWTGGGVANWLTNYNAQHSTSFQATDRWFPGGDGGNYPYDYWSLWAGGHCTSQSGTECLATLTQTYNVIIFKHCFPAADVLADTGSPDISSSRMSLENYKLQYRALRAEMDKYPNNKFIVWTLAPLHRLATNAGNAARARQFVDWIKNDFLTEDGHSHPNIFVFDFFGYVAGSDNYLKYEYEGSHSSSDSHPNSTANAYVGPIFSQFIVDTAQGSGGSSPVPACTESWSCGNWSACVNDRQTRTCADANSCGPSTQKPGLIRNCTNSNNKFFVTGQSQGAAPLVRVLTNAGKLERQITAYEKTFTGGVSVAAADLGGDGTNEIIVGPGKGREPLVKIFRRDGSLAASFLAYSKDMKNGITVAAGDVNGDSRAEIIVAPQGGSQSIRIFNLQSGKYVRLGQDFSAYSSGFRGGISVAACDLSGDGVAELVTVPQSKGSSKIRVFGLSGGKISRQGSELLAYSSTFQGGASVACGDTDGDGKDEIITGVYSQAGPKVKVFRRTSGGMISAVNSGFNAFSASFLGGVSVAAVNLDNDSTDEIIVSVRSGGDPLVRIFSNTGKTIRKALYAFPRSVKTGVVVSAGQ